ncbi:hypothetical protein MTDSW087_02407 [Methylobacterium dankookense]|uniref:Cellulose biosynthesis protein BcsN n=2 Tax=Methylobacterium dankookense TaxID=560405 RepID=A0A564FXW4_9HYPH|nr:hypothetical protein IFDJLNFL_4502 [Methylobacterium dankookense]VUF12714.1 hypothetical protein MTDSW087_02407 [Methylobacterium dankookense]
MIRDVGPGLRADTLIGALGFLVASLAATQAMAQPVPVLRLPGAGPVGGVVETRLRDGFDQRIRFEGGDGRNHAEIALRNETGDLLLAFPPRLAKPSQFGIEGEIAVRFPGQILRVVLAPRRNAYGPVGMAVGADCLYAWQWFERPSAGQRSADGPGAFGPLVQPTPGRRAMSLRIRLCRTALASLDDLIAAVERLTISLPDAVVIQRPNRPVVRRTPSPPMRAAKRPAPTEAEPKPAAQQKPAPLPPSAPPPPAQPAPPNTPPTTANPDVSGRRYIAPSEPPEIAPSEPSASGRAQRFITDEHRSADPPSRALMPNPASGRATGESLSRDLPPEAYKPPPDRRGR